MKQSSDSPQVRQQKASKILAILRDFLGDDLSDLSCLDLGGREGVITKELAKHFRRIVGIDIAVISQAIHSISFAQANGAQLPFPNKHFDVIIFAQVYEHVASPSALISEINRVLKPGGVVFFSGPNRWALIEEHYHLPFLSWLPRWAANPYMRITKRENTYDIRPLSFRQLKKLWKDFEIYDYIGKILSDPQKYSLEDRIRIRIPALVTRWVRWLVPNFNWILVNPINVYPSLSEKGIVTMEYPPEPSHNDYTQEYYLSECDGHEEFSTSLGKSLPTRLSHPLEIADIQPGQRVLDVGCGRGELALHCAQKGALVWGLDYAPAALTLAQSLSAPPNMAIQLALASQLPIASESIDVVFMLDIVEHLNSEDLRAALWEARRTLKPGGQIIIHTMPNLWYYNYGYPIYRLTQRFRGHNLPKNPRARWRFAHLHVNEQTPLTLRAAMLESNFQPQIWLESTQNYRNETNPIVKLIMKTLTRIYPFKWVFCNDIFAIGTKYENRHCSAGHP